MILISGTSNASLAQGIADQLCKNLTETVVRKFADAEIFVEIMENIRGQDVFIIQPTNFPANDHLMELMILIDAARRGSAQRITAVVPYYGYARQDRKTGPRTAITAKLVANMITSAGADRVLTIDLHSGQIQGFFDIPLDNLMACPVFVNDVKSNHNNMSEIMVVSPDIGGVVRARHFAHKLGNLDLAIIDKRRPKAGVSEVMNVIGDVGGKHCLLVDDMVDSGGTLCNAADALLKNGAISVSAYCTHGVLSGKAVERICSSRLQELVITNSIDQTSALTSIEKIRVLDVAPLLAEACSRIHFGRSISTLFE